MEGKFKGVLIVGPRARTLAEHQEILAERAQRKISRFIHASEKRAVDEIYNLAAKSGENREGKETEKEFCLSIIREDVRHKDQEELTSLLNELYNLDPGSKAPPRNYYLGDFNKKINPVKLTKETQEIMDKENSRPIFVVDLEYNIIDGNEIGSRWLFHHTPVFSGRNLIIEYERKNTYSDFKLDNYIGQISEGKTVEATCWVGVPFASPMNKTLHRYSPCYNNSGELIGIMVEFDIKNDDDQDVLNAS